MRDGFRWVFTALAGLMFLATIALLFLAGVGAFDEAPRSDAFQPHRMVAMSLFGVAVLAVAVAALARVPGRLIGRTALVAGLVVLQSLIAMVSRAFEEQSTTASVVVFGLHAINGLVTMEAARTVFLRARGLAAGRAPAAAPAGAEPARS